MSSNSKV
jgi:hypothetical protein